MRTVIAGSRNITDKNLVFNCIKKSKLAITEIVYGGDRGVQQLGEDYAFANGIAVIPFWADWKYGDAASAIRNKEMAEYCDFGIVFLDKKSSGVINLLENLRSAGKKFIVWYKQGNRKKYPEN